MRKIIAIMLLVSVPSLAEPTSYIVKAGTLLTDGDEIVEVDAGMFLNDEGAKAIRNTMGALIDQNELLIQKLTSANQKIADCKPYIPGLPTWAYVAITAGLTVLTAVASIFVAREAM